MTIPDFVARKKVERIFAVPIPRSPSYVAREDVHDRLNELLAAENDFQPRAALWALGGMG